MKVGDEGGGGESKERKFKGEGVVEIKVVVRLRVRAGITSPVWVLRHMSGKARRLRILLGMEWTSNAARRDGSTPKLGRLFLREP